MWIARYMHGLTIYRQRLHFVHFKNKSKTRANALTGSASSFYWRSIKLTFLITQKSKLRLQLLKKQDLSSRWIEEGIGDEQERYKGRVAIRWALEWRPSGNKHDGCIGKDEIAESTSVYRISMCASSHSPTHPPPPGATAERRMTTSSYVGWSIPRGANSRLTPKSLFLSLGGKV